MSASFSLDAPLLDEILRHARPLGRPEDPETLNLGFGFLHYGLIRALRPRHIAVIGSGFGVRVLCLALAVKDNGVGNVSLVDPSCSLPRPGLPSEFTDHQMTSAEFFAGYDERGLPAIDLAFIDGNQPFEEVRHDFIEVCRHTHRNSYVLLHDTNLPMREMIRHAGGKRWLRVVKRDSECFEVVDFPFSSGVALVRMLRDGPWHPGA